MSDTYPTTRRSLHGLAELVLAGPRHAAGGSMRLRADDGGIRTWDEPVVRLTRGQLVTDGVRVQVAGRTFAEAAAAIGVQAHGLADVYSDGPGVRADEVVVLDAAAVVIVEDALARGDEALRRFAPDLEPVLWPEHFDVAITRDEVTYGLSPGDAFHPLPYAYVGPFEPRVGPFWNAPFGAARPLAELAHVGAVADFYAAGAEAVRRDATPSEG